MAQLPEPLSGLMRPEAYPHPVSAIHLVQTHVSWVLLTGEFAYKIKRPVRYPFLDLTSEAQRAFFCHEELRLNRRFAPALYLGVCDITLRDGQVFIGGPGNVIERCVRMRQFSGERELDRLLANDAVAPEVLYVFGRELAEIHDSLPVATSDQPWGHADGVTKVLLDNVAGYEEATQGMRLRTAQDAAKSLREAFAERLKELAPLIEARRAGGRVRECHGDLHSRNIVLQEGKLVAFDCMEFEPAFRWIDVAEEIAFLLADLQARERALHAHAFLTGYLDVSGDYAACRVLDLYRAHRALVRAKVTALEMGAVPSSGADDALASMQRQHDAHLRVAMEALSLRKPRLILMSGLSGSGKTWLARQLARELGAVHVRSDVERKRAAGIGELASSGSATGGGLYAPEVTRRMYARLGEIARNVLSGGYSVIVDATFLARAHRTVVIESARSIDAPVCVVRCDAPEAVLRERILMRARSGRDASEADTAVLDWQLAHQEPIAAEEQLNVIAVDTRDPGAVSALVQRLR